MIPTHAIDSTEAAEHRDAVAEAERESLAADREHAERCRDGWLGVDDDERPIACRRCRPHLAPSRCRTCGVPDRTCTAQRAAGRGGCCGHCDHHQADKTRRPRAMLAAAAGDRPGCPPDRLTTVAVADLPQAEAHR